MRSGRKASRGTLRMASSTTGAVTPRASTCRRTIVSRLLFSSGSVADIVVSARWFCNGLQRCSAPRVCVSRTKPACHSGQARFPARAGPEPREPRIGAAGDSHAREESLRAERPAYLAFHGTERAALGRLFFLQNGMKHALCRSSSQQVIWKYQRHHGSHAGRAFDVHVPAMRCSERAHERQSDAGARTFARERCFAAELFKRQGQARELFRFHAGTAVAYTQYPCLS